jgi:hypothetical protein
MPVSFVPFAFLPPISLRHSSERGTIESDIGLWNVSHIRKKLLSSAGFGLFGAKPNPPSARVKHAGVSFSRPPDVVSCGELMTTMLEQIAEPTPSTHPLFCSTILYCSSLTRVKIWNDYGLKQMQGELDIPLLYCI